MTSKRSELVNKTWPKPDQRPPPGPGSSQPAKQSPVPPVTPVPSTPTQIPGTKTDAWAYLDDLLDYYNLPELKDFAKTAIIDGASSTETLQRLRQTDVWKKRWWVIEEFRKQGLPPVSEAEVLAYEKESNALMRSANLPRQFWDEPQDAQKLMAQGLSISELDWRINQGAADVQSSSAEVRSELERFYGMDQGSLIAYYLDPSRTKEILVNQLGAAQVSASAMRSGFGRLDKSEAERLNQVGVTPEQAADRFGTLVQSGELLTSLPGQTQDDITRQDQLRFIEGNAEAEERLRRRSRERISTFGSGGGVATTQQGATGAGVAR